MEGNHRLVIKMQWPNSNKAADLHAT